MNRAGGRSTSLYGTLLLVLFGCMTGPSSPGQSLPPAQAAQQAVDASAPTPSATEFTPSAGANEQLLAVPVKILGGRLPFQIGATVGGYYDDNIYLRPPGVTHLEDFIWSVSPLIAWNSAAQTGAVNSVQLAYAPTLIFYQDYTGNDTVDEAANAVYGYEGDKIKVVVSEAFASYQEDDADNTDLVTETSSVTNVSLNYMMTAKTNLSLIARQIYTSDDPGYASIEWTLAGYADYAMTAKSSLGLGGVLGAVDLDGPNQTYQQVNGRFSYDPDPKLDFSITGGAEVRETQHHDGIQLNPDFSLSADYMPFDGTNLGLTAYRRFSYSNRLFGEDYLASGVSASVSQRFLHKFLFVLSGVFENAAYQNNFAVATTSQNYDYLSIRPGFEFAPMAGCNLKIFYQYRTSLTNGGLTDFNDDQVGFSAQFLY